MNVAVSAHPPRTSEQNRDLERVQGCQKEWLELVLKAAQEMDPVPRAKNAAALAVENLAKSLIWASLSIWMINEPWPPSVIVSKCHLYSEICAFLLSFPEPQDHRMWIQNS